MSVQLETFKQLIHNTRSGNRAAEELLRQICREAVGVAPTSDLLILAECLVQMGLRDEKAAREKNNGG